jgi:hypothetical protein
MISKICRFVAALVPALGAAKARRVTLLFVLVLSAAALVFLQRAELATLANKISRPDLAPSQRPGHYFRSGLWLADVRTFANVFHFLVEPDPTTSTNAVVRG